MSKVTIIVPAFNAETYIEQCANSIFNQTLQDIEIILIDDGSTDETGIILDRLVKGHNNARVIHQENKGLYKTREIGLSLATGDYIGWVDADDFVEPQMFEILYNTALEHESELVICNYNWFPNRIPTKEKWFREYKGVVDTTFVEHNSQPWNKIVKKTLMEKLEIGKHFTNCFDEIYILLMLEAKNPITINRPLYNYRVGAGTMSTSYKDVLHYRKFAEASEELRKVMQAFDIDIYWKEYFDFRVAYYLLMTMIVAANSGNKDEYKRNREELFQMEPRYNTNQHYWNILKRNFGYLRAVAIDRIVPVSYSFAHFACRVGI